jgi:Fe-S cluster assembly ATPase SufC
MPLMLPADFKDVSADPKHPYFRPEALSPNLVIFLNGEPTSGLDIVVASETNGYLKVLRKVHGEYVISPRHKDRLDTTIIKGKVQIFMRKDDADQAERKS